MNLDLLKADLQRDEGTKTRLYWDTAVPPKASIGTGRNLTDDGISPDEAAYLLINDINAAIGASAQAFPWLSSCPEPVQRGLTNMIFNMGLPRLLGFKKMLAALQAGLWETAAQEAENSSWATQVGDRANRIAQLFRSAG